MTLNLSFKEYFLSLYAIGFGLLLICSCTKTEDPPRKVGQALPSAGPTRTLTQLLDSLPDATLYKAIYQRSDLPHVIDSLSRGNTTTPFTLFVPTDKALQEAGYTSDVIKAAAGADLDTLVRYLALAGNFRTNPAVTSSTDVYPLMDPDPNLERTVDPPVFRIYTPYNYSLNIGFSGSSLLLNGRKASSQNIPLAATNGSIYRLDSLVQKPFYEMYQIVSSDTSYSLYMAALRISDSLYSVTGLMGWNSPTSYNDTAALMLNASNGTPGTDPFVILLAPDNNAFRRAGFQSPGDISAYIGQSALVSNPYGTMLTNMDSILSYHQLVYKLTDWVTGTAIGVNQSYFYTNDMLNNPTIAVAHDPYAFEQTFNNVVFQNNGGTITVHRTDAPSGRAATIISPSDITTLNGVIHRVDNLLLPTP